MRNLNELYEKYPFLFDKVKINEDGVFHALITVDAFHKRRANDFNLMYMSKEKLAELFNDIYFISAIPQEKKSFCIPWIIRENRFGEKYFSC